MSLHPVILADAITTVTAGPSVGLRGERIALGNPSNLTRRDLAIQVFLKFTGAAASTCTAQVQVSADASSWTSWGPSLVITIGADGLGIPKNSVGKLGSLYDYIRVNVSAVSGMTVNGYVVRRG